MYADTWPADSAVARAALLASEHSAAPDDRLLERTTIWGRRVSIAVAVLATLCVVVWPLGHRPLTDLFPSLPPMELWVAVDLALLGVLVATVDVRRPSWLGVPWHLVAGFVVGSALVFFDREIDYFNRSGIRIFNASPLSVDDLSGHPSFMSLTTVAVLGVAAFLARHGQRTGTQLLALVGGLLALVAINTYAFNPDGLFEFGTFTTMALPAAILTLGLTFSLVVFTLEGGPLKVAAAQGEGGRLIRRMLPASLVGLVALEVVASQVVKRTTTVPSFTYGLSMTATMVMVSALIYYQGRALRRVDARRTGAEQALEVVRDLMETRDELTRQLDEHSRVLQQIIETSPDAFVSMDERGLVTAWNPAAEAIFGWTRGEVLGKPLHALIVPEFEHWVRGGDFPDRVGSIEAFQARSKDVDTVRKDGTRIRVDLTLWPATKEPSRAYYAFARDVTVRREAEDRLLEANSDLREFAAIAAHDLRNPLVAVRLAAEMLAESTKDGVVDEQGREWIGRIQAATLRGQELISDLLEYSSLSSGPRETSRVDLTRLVEDIADQVALGSDREFTVDLEPLPVIEGDLPRIRQLFANLLGNAAKYVPHDRPAVVRVSARAGRRMVRILVTDNGDGISDADKATIFGAFQRGSANGETPGTGIGLAICRKVVERHGGTIRIEDAPDGGATFVIELPRWPGAMTIGLGGDVPTTLVSGYGL